MSTQIQPKSPHDARDEWRILKNSASLRSPRRHNRQSLSNFHNCTCKHKSCVMRPPVRVGRTSTPAPNLQVRLFGSQCITRCLNLLLLRTIRLHRVLGAPVGHASGLSRQSGGLSNVAASGGCCWFRLYCDVVRTPSSAPVPLVRLCHCAPKQMPAKASLIRSQVVHERRVHPWWRLPLVQI